MMKSIVHKNVMIIFTHGTTDEVILKCIVCLLKKKSPQTDFFLLLI